MSFSSDAKTELCRATTNRKCCAQAEIYGVLLYCNTFNQREVRIITESDALLRRLPILLKKAFRMTFDRVPQEGEEGKRTLLIENPEKMQTISRCYGRDASGLAHHINFAVLEERCCQIAFLRGAFLAGGSVTDPQKGYHLEITTPHYSVSREMLALMGECGFDPKGAVRKANYIAYFKKSEYIEDILTSLGAPIAAMELMNTKLEKHIRGSVNRRVNCDAANLDKVVEAAQVQLEAIRTLDKIGQLELQPEKLRETARLRTEHPEYTLAQLAELHIPVLTKSALNHRLRKLVELARGTQDAT